MFLQHFADPAREVGVAPSCQEIPVVRRAGLWIFTLSFAAALPYLVGSGGASRERRRAPLEPARRRVLVGGGARLRSAVRRSWRARARRGSSAHAAWSPSPRSQAW